MTRSHTPSCAFPIETRKMHALAHLQPSSRVSPAAVVTVWKGFWNAILATWHPGPAPPKGGAGCYKKWGEGMRTMPSDAHRNWQLAAGIGFWGPFLWYMLMVWLVLLKCMRPWAAYFKHGLAYLQVPPYPQCCHYNYNCHLHGIVCHKFLITTAECCLAIAPCICMFL